MVVPDLTLMTEEEREGGREGGRGGEGRGGEGREGREGRGEGRGGREGGEEDNTVMGLIVLLVQISKENTHKACIRTMTANLLQTHA